MVRAKNKRSENDGTFHHIANTVLPQREECTMVSFAAVRHTLMCFSIFIRCNYRTLANWWHFCRMCAVQILPWWSSHLVQLRPDDDDVDHKKVDDQDQHKGGFNNEFHLYTTFTTTMSWTIITATVLLMKSIPGQVGFFCVFGTTVVAPFLFISFTMIKLEK